MRQVVLERKMTSEPHPNWRGMTVAQLRAALLEAVAYADESQLNALTFAMEDSGSDGECPLLVPEVHPGLEGFDERRLKLGKVRRQADQELRPRVSGGGKVDR